MRLGWTRRTAIRRLVAVSLGCALLATSSAMAAEPSRAFVTVDGKLCPARVEFRRDASFIEVRQLAECLGGGAAYHHDYNEGKLVIAYGPHYVEAWTEEWTGKTRLMKVYEGSPLSDFEPDIYDLGPHASYESLVDKANMVQTRWLMDALGLFVDWDGANRIIIIRTDENAIPPPTYDEWIPWYQVLPGAERTLPSLLQTRRCLWVNGPTVVEEFRLLGYRAEIDWWTLRVRAYIGDRPAYDYYCSDHIPGGGYVVTWHTVASAQKVAGQLDLQADSIDAWGNVGSTASGAIATIGKWQGVLNTGAASGVVLLGAAVYGVKEAKKVSLRASASRVRDCASTAKSRALERGLTEEDAMVALLGLVVYASGDEELTVGCVPELTDSAVTLRGSYYRTGR